KGLGTRSPRSLQGMTLWLFVVRRCRVRRSLASWRKRCGTPSSWWRGTLTRRDSDSLRQSPPHSATTELRSGTWLSPTPETTSPLGGSAILRVLRVSFTTRCALHVLSALRKRSGVLTLRRHWAVPGWMRSLVRTGNAPQSCTRRSGPDSRSRTRTLCGLTCLWRLRMIVSATLPVLAISCGTDAAGSRPIPLCGKRCTALVRHSLLQRKLRRREASL